MADQASAPVRKGGRPTVRPTLQDLQAAAPAAAPAAAQPHQPGVAQNRAYQSPYAPIVAPHPTRSAALTAAAHIRSEMASPKRLANTPTSKKRKSRAKKNPEALERAVAQNLNEIQDSYQNQNARAAAPVTRGVYSGGRLPSDHVYDYPDPELCVSGRMVTERDVVRPRPEVERLTPELPYYTHENQRAQTFAPVQPAMPIDLDNNPDMIALQATAAALITQRDRATRDMGTLRDFLNRIRAEPEAWLQALQNGEVGPGKDELSYYHYQTGARIVRSQGGWDIQFNFPGNDGSASQTVHVDNFFSRPIPGPQNIAPVPNINWAKYGVVGEPLNLMHQDRIQNPGSSRPANLTSNLMVDPALQGPPPAQSTVPGPMLGSASTPIAHNTRAAAPYTSLYEANRQPHPYSANNAPSRGPNFSGSQNQALPAGHGLASTYSQTPILPPGRAHPAYMPQNFAQSAPGQSRPTSSHSDVSANNGRLRDTMAPYAQQNRDRVDSASIIDSGSDASTDTPIVNAPPTTLGLTTRPTQNNGNNAREVFGAIRQTNLPHSGGYVEYEPLPFGTLDFSRAKMAPTAGNTGPAFGNTQGGGPNKPNTSTATAPLPRNNMAQAINNQAEGIRNAFNAANNATTTPTTAANTSNAAAARNNTTAAQFSVGWAANTAPATPSMTTTPIPVPTTASSAKKSKGASPAGKGSGAKSGGGGGK